MQQERTTITSQRASSIDSVLPIGIGNDVSFNTKDSVSVASEFQSTQALKRLAYHQSLMQLHVKEKQEVSSAKDLAQDESTINSSNNIQQNFIISTLPHSDFSEKNQCWVIVQQALLNVFQRKRVDNLGKVIQNVRHLTKSEAGPFIHDYMFRVFRRGMMFLRSSVITASANEVMLDLEDIWNYLYKEALHTILAILHPVNVFRQNHSIEEALLLEFRRRVVMKSKLYEALLLFKQRQQLENAQKLQDNDQYHEVFSPIIQQMLLVLQSVRESSPPSEDDIAFERMVALVIQPYLGYLGLYNGEATPSVKAEIRTIPANRKFSREEKKMVYQDVKESQFASMRQLDRPARIPVVSRDRGDSFDCVVSHSKKHVNIIAYR